MGKTTIEWTSFQRWDGSIVPGYTFSPVIGCAKKSPGCKYCYAEYETPARISRHKGVELWGVNAARRPTGDNYWKQPLKWNTEAALMGERRIVFCSSQSDWLECRPEWVEPRAKLLKLISQTQNLLWLLLSKEPWNFNLLTGDAAEYWREEDPDFSKMINHWKDGVLFPSNIWLGTSVENQEWANKRREAFRSLPAIRKFVSYEPALSPVKWDWWEFCDWFISGGESAKPGQEARVTHPDWHRETRDWCIQNQKSYLFKQWGHYRPLGSVDNVEDSDTKAIAESNPDACFVVYHDGQRTLPEDEAWQPGRGGYVVEPVGKHKSGRLLDGRIWHQIPELSPE